MAAERFIGGLRIGWLNATEPLAELLTDDERVVLQARSEWQRRFVRVFFFFIETTWEAPRATVTAEGMRGWISRGVQLHASGRPSAIFWCDERTARQVLAILQASVPA